MTQSTQQPPPPGQGYGSPYYGMPTMPAPNGELVVKDRRVSVATEDAASPA